MDSLTQEIAAVAARLVVEDGLDYGTAKQRACKITGAPQRTQLPDNDTVQEQVREYLDLFCADTQPAELAALRQLALHWMERLQAFRPHVSGAVWNGTATRLSDIWLQLFCDDPKSAEIALIDEGVRYSVNATAGFNGEVVDVLSFSWPCPELEEHIGVHLMIYDRIAIRGALKPRAGGDKPRGNRQDLADRMTSGRMT
ncbi:MAG: hypothetical protein WCZ18_02785 [Ottowia sp.]|nr:hypothetical protein [Ottowia sp.]